jgi:hypothetical protein
VGWDGFISNVYFEVGSGDRVWFWHGRWCRDQSLKELYPVLYCLTGRHRCFNILYLECSTEGSEKNRNVQFIILLNDWEFNSAASMLEL